MMPYSSITGAGSSICLVAETRLHGHTSLQKWRGATYSYTPKGVQPCEVGVVSQFDPI